MRCDVLQRVVYPQLLSRKRAKGLEAPLPYNVMQVTDDETGATQYAFLKTLANEQWRELVVDESGRPVQNHVTKTRRPHAGCVVRKLCLCGGGGVTGVGSLLL